MALEGRLLSGANRKINMFLVTRWYVNEKKNLNFLTHCGITLLGSVQCIKACWIIIVYDEKKYEFYFWSCNILAAIK